MKNPCYNCEKRHIGCHVTCDKYIEYKKRINHTNGMIKREKNAVIAEYIRDKRKEAVRSR